MARKVPRGAAATERGLKQVVRTVFWSRMQSLGVRDEDR